ncbi:hypothetical protein [Roseburia sp. 1XD42-34]|uniref:hypothetical protein n=1 Tax=Roseburia sp. 1XD42-34 TaxID=2305905 RepID=UPI0018F3D450|nr:hypothetical protein [Roseburia sp. 1XD42-34]
MLSVTSGFYFLQQVNDGQLKPIIGAIVLLMISLNVIRDRLGERLTRFYQIPYFLQ